MLQSSSSAIKSNIVNIKQHISAVCKANSRSETDVEIIAVSKGHNKEAIFQAIRSGIESFAENRVQEAQEKWPEIKNNHPEIKLHLIGPLQTNKVKDAVRLFDVIQTLERTSLAEALFAEMCKQQKFLECYVQINTGEEAQKSGISPDKADEFIENCRAMKLDISGLMCIPPLNVPAAPHFAFLRKIAIRNDIKHLSMGMSGDYIEAVRQGATHVRIGTAIFGQR